MTHRGDARCGRARAIALATAAGLVVGCGAAGSERTAGGPTDGEDTVELDLRVSEHDELPTETVELPDGRSARVTGTEVVWRDDVEVTLARLEDDDELAVLVVSPDEVLVPVRSGLVADDGVRLLASPAEPPAPPGVTYELTWYPMAHVPTDVPIAVEVVHPDTAMVCVQLLGMAGREHISERVQVPGQEFSEPLAESHEPVVELACSEPDAEPEPIDRHQHVAELVGIDPVIADDAELRSRVEVDVDRVRDGEAVVSLRSREDVEVRLPSDHSTLAVFAGVSVWLPDPDGPTVSVPGREATDLDVVEVSLDTGGFGEGGRSPAEHGTLCVEVLSDDGGILACGSQRW